MKASVRVVLVCLAASAALVAVPALALPAAPCSTGGSLGPCPAWVDNDGNGKWDSGDTLITFSSEPTGDNDMTIVTPWGDGKIVFDTITIPTLQEAVDTGEYNAASWMGMGYCAVVTYKNAAGAATAFSLYEGGCPSGSELRAGDFVGIMNLTDNDGDDEYDGLVLAEGSSTKTLAAQASYLETDIICTDVGGDGECDHLSLPWAADTVRKIGMDEGDGQVWIPFNQDGPYARRMTFGLPVSGGTVPESVVFAARTAEGIPTLSEWGVLVSLLGLAAAGWWLLRRRQVVA